MKKLKHVFLLVLMALAVWLPMSQNVSAAPPPSNTQNLTPGKYSFRNVGTGYMMNYGWGWQGLGYNPIIMSNEDGSPEQTFNLQYIDQGRYWMQICHSDGGTVNIWKSSGNAEAGNKLGGWSLNTASWLQQFYLTPVNGGYIIQSATDPSKVVAAPNNEWHAQLEIQNYAEGNTAQIWALQSKEPVHVHVYGNWTTKKAATKLKSGLKERICTECGHREESVIPQLIPETEVNAILKLKIDLKISCGKSGVILKWNEVQNATGYVIYRGNTKIATVKAGTKSYTDKTAKTNGTTYTYRIACYIKDGTIVKSGVKSASFSVRFLTATTIQTTKPSVGRITVNWEKNSKCAGYRIYYSTNSDFSNAKSVTIKDKNTLSVVLKNLTYVKYYIRIRCYIKINGTTCYSAWSPVQTCMPAAPKYTQTGRIIDSTTGKNMSGATLYIRKGNSRSGSVYCTTTTNAKGIYSAKLPKGTYTIQVEKSGYITIYITIDVTIDITVAQTVPISMSRKLSSGEYRVVLTWKKDPRDLDLHLVGNGGYGSFHAWFNLMNPGANAQLDIDQQHSYGPETITFKVKSDGNYTCYVHKYAGDGTLATSGATVRVYKGNSLIATYKAPTGSSYNSWRVFSIKKGKLITLNTVTTIATGEEKNYAVY